MNNEKQRPVHELRIGTNKAAVWRHAGPDGRERFTIRFVRLIRSGQGPGRSWTSSDFFGPDDLLEVAKLADAAHSWCVANPLPRSER